MKNLITAPTVEKILRTAACDRLFEWHNSANQIISAATVDGIMKGADIKATVGKACRQIIEATEKVKDEYGLE